MQFQPLSLQRNGLDQHRTPLILPKLLHPVNLNFTFLLTLVTLLSCFSGQAQKTDIMLLGSDHLAQLYKPNQPHSDVLRPNRQAELAQFASLIAAYKPDMILVEVLPQKQHRIDSLYARYVRNELNLSELEGGRSEVYQLAFKLAKQFGLPTIYCVDAPGGRHKVSWTTVRI